MFIVIAIMLGGILVGFVLRKADIRREISRATTVLIWLLLLILGFEAGQNDNIINSLTTLGVEGLLISTLSVLGSCAGAWLLWYYVVKRIKEDRE